jgi:hypothetical protein
MTAADYPEFDGTQVCATVDPEEFHPEQGERIDAAKRICKGDPDRGIAPCAFLNPCLQYALHHSVSGVWGGTSGLERQNLRRKLHIVAQPLSFGTGPTNVTTAKRMASRGTPVVRIAEHLQITQEAVQRILRQGRAEPAGTLDAHGRKACPDCGRRMKPDSMRKHKRDYCAAREAVA